MQFTEEISLVSTGGLKIRNKICLYEKTLTTKIDVALTTDVGIVLLL